LPKSHWFFAGSSFCDFLQTSLVHVLKLVMHQ
jgi:hypothetical protein